MDISDIAAKIKSGDYTLMKFSGKSACWKVFEKVIDSAGKEVFGVACCAQCISCIVYKKLDSNGTVTDYGTKNLLGHMKHCKSSGHSNAAGNLKSYFESTVTLDKSTANLVKVAQTKMVSGCHMSFNVVENETYKSFAQTMISVGAKYGNVKAASVLYGRKTIKEKTIDMAHKLRDQIKSNVQKAATEGSVSMVTDMWSDNVVQNSYMEVTFFWISDESDNWKLKRGMFECKYFPDRKTADNIAKALDDCLISAGLQPESIPVTTDKGANVVAAK